ncbi:hypothetical protein CYLTODRAFT_344529 [Cylindrobasidium torrendii FP15055 ss-10]|uniref:Nucleoporin n=1 Tax=Cylindrobasidium torrendii FP15055 ss-10 TaxID=1314674 RepID=A0A0D7BNM4_9AGAR|nr:hypothetical protein CYLTODRAFT_344529 [Cylindrobasidium torrendii FP15055 ss-10]
MDVDDGQHSIASDRTIGGGYGSLLFAKSEQMSAAYYSQLPIQVVQALKSADFRAREFSGEVDTRTNYALVTTKETCFVWQREQAVRNTPTTYILPCPPTIFETYQTHENIFHGLVPYTTQREPGLILISSSGHIRIWDSITIGLAGGDPFTSAKLPLTHPEEYVTNLVRVQDQTFVASSSMGAIYRLVLAPLGGKLHLNMRTFSLPVTSSLSRLYTTLFASPSTPISAPGNVSGLCVGRDTADNGHTVWALADTRLQKWELKPEGWEDLLLDLDIQEEVAKYLRKNLQIEQQLIFSNLVMDASGDLVILVEYIDEDKETDSLNTTYAIVRIRCFSDNLSVQDAQVVPYQALTKTTLSVPPRLSLMHNGEMAVVQFGDNVCFVYRRSEFKDRLQLNGSHIRTLGLGILESDDSVLILTSSMVLKVSLAFARIQEMTTTDDRVKLIQSTMTQAIIYTPIRDNPLKFTFPPGLDPESLMTAATKLSDMVMKSDPSLVSPNNDMHQQLSIRKERLSFLMDFINVNEVQDKVDVLCRQRLMTDIEKIYAADQVWLQHNEDLQSGISMGILDLAVRMYLEGRGEQHEDPIRAFLRYHVSDLTEVLCLVPPAVRALLATTKADRVLLANEANRILLCVSSKTLEYRKFNARVYGLLDARLDIWTSQPKLIQVMEELFIEATNIVASPATNKYAPSVREQLPGMAKDLLKILFERTQWLIEASDEDEHLAQESHDAQTKFDNVRPAALEALSANGFISEAFTLGEKYGDFGSLAMLCTRKDVYPPDENPYIEQIAHYLERYNDSFAKELYAMYIKIGELRCLFAQDESHVGYMDRFFYDRPNPQIQWIHEMGQRRYADAAQSLAKAADGAPLPTQEFVFSLGKLSSLAAGHDGPEEMSQFEVGLQFITVQNQLLEEFEGVIEGTRGKQSLETKVETVVNRLARNLRARTAHVSVFKDIVRDALQGKALTVEDAIDALSMKDNDNTPQHYARALRLLADDTKIPTGRKEAAFCAVWRRIYLHDDWPAIQVTEGVPDSELNNRLRQSAAYAVFEAMYRDKIRLEEYDRTPIDALNRTPTRAELASRWPGKSPDELERINNDDLWEADLIGEWSLEASYEKLKVLAADDVLGMEEV